MKQVLYALLACSGLYASEPSAWNAFKEAVKNYQEQCKKEQEERRKNQHPYHPDESYAYGQLPHQRRSIEHGYHFAPITTAFELLVINCPTFPEKPSANMPFESLIGEWYIRQAHQVDKYFAGRPEATLKEIMREQKVDMTHLNQIKVRTAQGIKPLPELNFAEFREWISQM